LEVINYYLRYKLKNKVSTPPNIDDINKSNKVLFSIFTRYGDTIIDLVVIKEFVEQYPQKKYLILCPIQMKPYVNEFLPNIECIAFNKRNLFKVFMVTKLLKKRMFNIGFNPWSNGLDSCYFISYCDKFLFYKDFDKPSYINHYQVIRMYLNLPEKEWFINELSLKVSYKKILICPQSTDINRNLRSEDLNRLILDFQKRYYNPDIIIASMNKSDLRDGCSKFIFEKTANSSEKFIDLIKKSSLIVCADSGPLHIALALNKEILVLMRATLPEIVINSGSSLIINK
jgi:ADP-heptose:LPS heptosyltransferase